MNNKTKYSIKNRFWICSEEGTFLGEGRIELLKNIDKHGSIKAAATAMNMSYKKAWNLMKSMNTQAITPLVHNTKGGKGGGGSELTESGEKALKLFIEYDLKIKKFINEELDLTKFLVKN